VRAVRWARGRRGLVVLLSSEASHARRRRRKEEVRTMHVEQKEKRSSPVCCAPVDINSNSPKHPFSSHPVNASTLLAAAPFGPFASYCIPKPPPVGAHRQQKTSLDSFPEFSPSVSRPSPALWCSTPSNGTLSSKLFVKSETLSNVGGIPPVPLPTVPQFGVLFSSQAEHSFLLQCSTTLHHPRP
jgi:hypothetical protein